ncbi:MAG TPA: class I SAM-dependent methyltransferase [Bryobacteraceae bacterium]|jgi:SAM-dependent methyltransferase|nr:class I SAM-dependent methyltransferase [Bryobacteraceae bacterium]
MNTQELARKKFLEDYRHIRHAEGRGSEQSGYYRALPESLPGDCNAQMWAMRAKTYSYFRNNILSSFEQTEKRRLSILDLGAGNCWLSNQLALRGHSVTAVDIFTDDRDGLGAARHYASSFKVIESDFDRLPVPDQSYDLAVFNASFHYSTDYLDTLTEVRRCLRPGGLFVILDSPMYRKKSHGLRMVEEKHATFKEKYGFRSDALPSIGFLDLPTVHSLASALAIEWHIFKPWYGWSWHWRPVKAFLANKRPPSRFWILTGGFQRP